MCDFSIAAPKHKAARTGQPLTTTKFGTTSSTGFKETGGDSDTAICLLPGTQLAFSKDVMLLVNDVPTSVGKVAHFTQIDKEQPSVHHDVLEFPNGKRVYLGHLPMGLEAKVLSLPVDPKLVADLGERKKAEVDQRRAVYAG